MVVVATVFAVHRLDNTADRGGDLGLVHGLLEPGHLRLLLLQVVLGLRLVQLGLLNLQSVGQLVGGGCLFRLLLQLLDLVFIGDDGVLNLLHLQLGAGHRQLQGVGVVGEEGVSLLDLVAHLDKALVYRLLVVLVHLDGGLGLHHAAVLAVACQIHAHQHGHRLDRGTALLPGGGAGCQTQTEQKRHYQRQIPFHLHSDSSFLAVPGILLRFLLLVLSL